MASLNPTNIEERPSKRPRVEDASEEHDTAGKKVIRQSTSFWFQDGNVAIIANEAVVFRVHRGVLARNSAVFRDMFEVPQPAGEDSLDGCPVIHVSDSPADFSRLLSAMYDGAKVFRHGGQLPFPSVAALVVLGHKYQVDHVCEEGLNRMKTCFTHSFPAMYNTAHSAYISKPDGSRELGLYSSSLQVVPSRDAIRAVNLVRLMEEESMLPIALYLCTLLPAASLVSGSTWLDGSQETLSTADLARCLDARSRFAMRACKRLERFWIPCFSDMCFSSHRCATILETKSVAQRQQRTVESTPSMFEDLERYVKNLQASGLCEECCKIVRSRQVDEMRFIWEKLPGDLGLEVANWDAAAPS